jgi:hypothetical protein
MAQPLQIDLEPAKIQALRKTYNPSAVSAAI